MKILVKMKMDLMNSHRPSAKRKGKVHGSSPSAKKKCLDPNINISSQPKDRPTLNLMSLCKRRSVESFAKLHRLDKLVSSLLASLRSTDGNEEVTFPKQLSKKWCNSFKQHMTTLSGSQIVNIFKSLLWSLNEDCIKPLEKNPIENNSIKILPIVSQLLCLYLSKVHMAEHTVPADVVSKFIREMDELKSLLGKLGCALLHREHDNTIMSSFLCSCLSWGDVQVLMLQYRPQAEITGVLDSPLTDSSATNLYGFHPYLSSDQWSLVAQRITNFGDLDCRCLLNQLVAQKFEVLVLFKTNSNRKVLSAAAKHLATSIDDGWPQLLGDSGFLLSSHLNATPLLELAQHVVKDIVNGGSGVESLQKTGIQESSPLLCALTVVTLIEIIKPWSNAKKKNESLSPCFDMMEAILKTLDPHILVDVRKDALDCSNIISGMAGIINAFLEIASDEVSSVAPKVDLVLMEQHFEILKVLPIQFLPQDFQMVVLLGFIALALSLEKTELEDKDKKKEVMQILHQNLLLGLLVGRNAPCVVTQLHAGLLVRWVLETDLQLSASQLQHLLRVLFRQSVEHPLSLGRLEVGMPLLRKGGQKEDLHPKQIDAAAVLQKTFVISLSKVSKTAFSEESKAQFKVMRRRLTKNLMIVLKSDISNDQSLIMKLQLQIIHMALQEYINKKKESKLDIIKPFLGTVLKEALIGVRNEDHECMQLVSTLLRNHAQVEKVLPSDFILQASDALSNVSNYMDLQTRLLLAANLQQFETITAKLLQFTMNLISGLSTESCSKNEDFPTLWTSMVVCDLIDRKSKIRQLALVKLYTLLLSALHLGSFTNLEALLKFNLAVVNCKQVKFSPEMLDCCLESITSQVLNSPKSVALALQLLICLLNNCTSQVLDTIPAFVQRFSHLVTIIAKAGSQDEITSDFNTDAVIETCGLSIEKLASSMVKHSKQFRRIASYIVANILHQFEILTLRSNIKLHLTNSVYSFLSICDTHAIAYLTHELPAASREIFSTFYNNYKKYYRYTGKL